MLVKEEESGDEGSICTATVCGKASTLTLTLVFIKTPPHITSRHVTLYQIYFIFSRNGRRSAAGLLLLLVFTVLYISKGPR